LALDAWNLIFMDIKIIIGWGLIAAGLTVIGMSVLASYRCFTAKAEFPEIFQIAAKNEQSFLPEQMQIENLPVEEAQKYLKNQIQYSVNRAVIDMMPDDAIAKMLNILAWSMFAAFLVYAGFKVCEIGIKMIKV